MASAEGMGKKTVERQAGIDAEALRWLLGATQKIPSHAFRSLHAAAAEVRHAA